MAPIHEFGSREVYISKCNSLYGHGFPTALLAMPRPCSRILTTPQLKAACKVMYDYIYKTIESIEKHFPEIDFMVTNTTFLEAASIEEFATTDMQAILKQESGPVTFPLDRVIMQFCLQLFY